MRSPTVRLDLEESALKTLVSAVPSMSSTTDEDDSSSPSEYSAHNGDMTPSLYPPSLASPMLSSSPLSPTTTSYTPNGLHYRPHHRTLSQQGPLLTSLINTPSPAQQSFLVTSPLNPTPRRRRGRTKKLTGLLMFLLAASMFATLSLTFYMMNQLNNEAAEEQSNHVVDDKTKRTILQHTTNKVSDSKANTDKPRVVYYVQQNHGNGKHVKKKRRMIDDATLHAPPGQEAAPQDDFDTNDYHDDDCVPMSDWQTSSFPNCNMIHELELQAAGKHVGKKNVDYEDRLAILGQGWFRHAWQVDVGATNETVILKTLR